MNKWKNESMMEGGYRGRMVWRIGGRMQRREKVGDEGMKEGKVEG